MNYLSNEEIREWELNMLVLQDFHTMEWTGKSKVYPSLSTLGVKRKDVEIRNVETYGRDSKRVMF